jgi:hypothetical protein
MFLNNILYFLFFFYILVNNAEVSFSIEIPSQEVMREVNTFYNNKINIYSSKFYLSDRVSINTNFMMGTSQKVIYLNYPFTFTNDTVTNSMKNANSSGIVILKDQPAGVTAANLTTQTGIVPIAYFTLQESPIGWLLYTPADYYQQESMITQISLYNNNIYFGRACGPTHQPSYFYDSSVSSLLNQSGKSNVVLGNYSGNFNNDKLLSYNTIVGFESGNLVTGSFNSFFGDYHASRKIINPNYLNQDYYSNNDYSNYNNSFGFGNYNLTHSTAQGLKFLANKQNNVFGNLNFSSIWRGYRNCIFGNRILTTEVDNITQFSWIDSNIIIGNNILYQYNNNLINGLYGNIIFIPNGDQAIYGGIGVSKAFGPIKNNPGAQCNYTIMIGSCGLPIPYQRSYKTFIANIYNSSLIQTGVPLNNTSKVSTLGNLGSTTFPVTVMINNADQLGQMELVPYRDFSLDGYNPNAEPGNVTDLDYVVNFLLDPSAMPIIGVAFENTAAATKNGLLYTVDAYSLINNASILANNPLASFVIYTTPKSPVPYSQSNSSFNNVLSAVTGDASVAGYEHYYLIPVLVRACQILNSKINTITNNNIACGDLIAAGSPGQTVALGNSNGTISIAGMEITPGNNNLLMINSSGNIITSNTTPSSFNCGPLTTTNLITNTLNPPVNGILNLQGTLVATGYLESTEIKLGSANGNYLIFDNNLGPNLDVIMQAKKDPASQLSLSANSNILMMGQGIQAPSSGTVQLLIGVNGAVTTLSSSERYKKNIQKCDIREKDINLLNPVSFQYKNDDSNFYYGFLAEEINSIESFKNTVIFNKNNEIESINYNSLFVAIFSYVLKKQKELQEQCNQLKSKYKKLYIKHNRIKQKLKINNDEIQELKKKYNDLKELLILFLSSGDSIE